MLEILTALLCLYSIVCWLYLTAELLDRSGRSSAGETAVCVIVILFAPLVVTVVGLVVLPGFLAYWAGRFCGHLKAEFRRGVWEAGR